MYAIASELLGNTDNVAEKWRREKNSTVDKLVIIGFAEQFAQIPAEYISRGRRGFVDAAFEHPTSKDIAIAERLQRRKRATNDIAVGIDPRERKLELCDTRVEPVYNFAEGAGFEFIVSIEEEHERRPGLIKAEQAGAPCATIAEPESCYTATIDHVPR